MEFSILGRTGLRVSRAGFGGGGIGQVWGSTTEQEAIRSVHRALELGITFFDVAPAYGDGKAEGSPGQGAPRPKRGGGHRHQSPAPGRRDGRRGGSGAPVARRQPGATATGFDRRASRPQPLHRAPRSIRQRDYRRRRARAGAGRLSGNATSRQDPLHRPFRHGPPPAHDAPVDWQRGIRHRPGLLQSAQHHRPGAKADRGRHIRQRADNSPWPRATTWASSASAPTRPARSRRPSTARPRPATR